MEYKDFVIKIAQKAGQIIRANFSIGMKKEWKKDDTPLTITDTTINRLVIEAVAKFFPGHSVLGEEESNQKESEFVWVCDPVDGTIPFSHGYPTFVFSLALTRNGESILGVLYDPMLDRLVYAEKGKGAFLNGKAIRVSSKATIDKTSFLNLDVDNKLDEMRIQLLKKGCFASVLYSAQYASMLVACGEFVAEIYVYDKPWDGASAKIIVEEAGGRVTDLCGEEQRYDKTIHGFIASNGLVHEELVSIYKNVSS